MRLERALAIGASASLVAMAGAQDIIVALDMDPSQPGIQQSITVPPGTTVVDGVAVYIWDQSGQHTASGMGCFICSVRATLVMGHFRGEERIIGRVASFDATLGVPALTGLDHFVSSQAPFNPFGGLGVDYFVNTNLGPQSGMFQTAPTSAQFTTSVSLVNATAGDVYRFYLVDVPAMLGGGVFHVGTPFAANAGGDAVPDMTPTLQGFDPDPPLPSPPAAFLVDFRDGPVTGGGATIIIDGCYADCDPNGGAGVLDIFDFLCFQDSFVSGEPYACDCDTSTGPICDIFDFLCFQDAFVSGCP